MIKILRISLTAAFIAVLGVVVVVSPSAAIAHEGHDHTTANTTTQDHAQAVKERVAGRLDAARQKVCDSRVTAIKKIMSNGAAAAQRNMNLFGKGAERIQQFYANKKLNVANYEQMVADIEAKKKTVEAAIAALKAVPEFSCTGDNPVGSADDYKAKLLDVRKALKDYRSSVQALLVAVKNAARAAEGAQ